MDEAPAGQVAFLFTDLEGSTRYWERRPDVMPEVYIRHDAILRSAIADQHGIVYKVIGDAFQVAFHSATAALSAALTAQCNLLQEPWPLSPAPRVRMALHVCDVAPQPDGDYRTPGLNRLGRLLTAADGGQILLSEPIARELADCLPPDAVLRDLGEHRFRDLSPQHVYQVHAPGLPTDPATLPGLAAHRDNFPPQPTTFIGRADELRRLQEMLRDRSTRVLTLVGPGGIGKTRLALATAAAVAEHYPDGVWFVPLAAVSDPALVPAAIAQVFAVRESIDQSLLDALIAYLAERETLLVLDNLEQVLAARRDIAALVAACPRQTVLLTSRIPLDIAGERIFPVPPLEVTTEGRDAVSGRGRPRPYELLAASDAVQLFAERARLVRPAFELTAVNVEAVATICQRLDGLPLAIELAAARSRLLNPAQLLARLASRLPQLTGGPRDLPARQQTLRAAIDWSYDLLAVEERTLLARLGIFSGGATLDAAEAVCGAADLFTVVESLARQSLLEVDESSVVPRVRMLETIREYALERLDQNHERDEIAVRHAAFFLDLAERAQAALAGPEQADWLDALAQEHDNVRAALDFYESRGAAADSIRLAGALWHFWWTRGHLSEGRERLRRALALATDDVPAAIRARALDGAGVLAEAQGDIDHAATSHEAALVLSREAGDTIGQARSLTNLGLIELHDRGNAGLAQERFVVALELYQREDDRPGIAAALSNMGDAALLHERFVEAAALYEEALGYFRHLDQPRDIANRLTSLGALAFFQGDYARAIGLYEEGLALWRQLGDLPGTAITLGNLGEALDHTGDVTRARELYAECLTLSSELGDRQGVAFAKSHLARVARNDGDPELAAALFIESTQICVEIGDDQRLAESLDGLAGALIDLGDVETAARLFGAARALRERTETPLLAVHRQAYESDLERVRVALGMERLAALTSEGETIPLSAIPALLARSHRPVDRVDWRPVTASGCAE